MNSHPSIVAILSGFLYAGAFVVTAVLARICWNLKRSKQNREILYPFLYITLAVVMLIFAIERPTGAVFEPLTQIVRSDAWQEGWYGSRRDLQSDVLQWAVLAAFPLFGWLLYYVRRALVRHLLLIAALVYYTGFAAVQLISYHFSDAVLMHRFGPVRGLQWLDGIGLCLAMAGVIQPLRETLQKGIASQAAPRPSAAPSRSSSSRPASPQQSPSRPALPRNSAPRPVPPKPTPSRPAPPKPPSLRPPSPPTKR